MRGPIQPSAASCCVKGHPRTEKPTPSVSLLPSLCFRLMSPAAEGLCTHLRPLSSLDRRVHPPFGVALLIFPNFEGLRRGVLDHSRMMVGSQENANGTRVKGGGNQNRAPR